MFDAEADAAAAAGEAAANQITEEDANLIMQSDEVITTGNSENPELTKENEEALLALDDEEVGGEGKVTTEPGDGARYLEVESYTYNSIEATKEGVSGEEEDIICLDDDGEVVGVSDSKKRRKSEEEDDPELDIKVDDEEDFMDIDEEGMISLERRNAVGEQIRKMSRNDLEDLVLAKIVEGVVAHTEVGKLRATVLELRKQKDRMTSKMGIMMKQIIELSSAVNQIVDNELREMKNRSLNNKPHIIRFNRSVGLQTNIEPHIRTNPPVIVHVPVPDKSIRPRQPNSLSQGKSNVPQGHALKRTHPHSSNISKSGVATGAENKNKLGAKNNYQVSVTTSSPNAKRVYTPVSTLSTQLPPGLIPIAAKPPPGSSQPGVVDLTDEEPTQNVVKLPSGITVAPTTTTNLNGIQYQIINSPTKRVQVVQAATTGQNYIVASPQQPQQVFIQQLNTNNQPAQQQHVAYRPVYPRNATVAAVPVPSSHPGTVSTVNSVLLNQSGNIQQQPQRIAVTIPSATTVVRANTTPTVVTSQPRFMLPPLPNAPPPKVKNDKFALPAKPALTLKEQSDGIVLSWNLPKVNNMAEVVTYQIYACQEDRFDPTKVPTNWKKVGDVKALPLPMACTLSQFTDENKYYFVVRGIDVLGRVGPFCDAQGIVLRLKK